MNQSTARIAAACVCFSVLCQTTIGNLALAQEAAVGQAPAPAPAASAAAPAPVEPAAPPAPGTEAAATSPAPAPVEQAAPPVPLAVKVEHTLDYLDNTRLKTLPTEITIVKAEQMQSSVAKSAALAIGMLFLGGVVINTHSKDNMVGKPIEPLADRSNIQNTTRALVAKLQASVNAAIAANPDLSGKTFKKSLLVAGGATNLVYESLTGDESLMYRLKTDVVVYKPLESFKLFSGPVKVDCTAASEKALPQSDWEKDNYLLVKTEQDAMLQACEKKVLAAVPDLFKP